MLTLLIGLFLIAVVLLVIIKLTKKKHGSSEGDILDDPSNFDE